VRLEIDNSKPVTRRPVETDAAARDFGFAPAWITAKGFGG